jgi:hypothetical protein
MKVGTSACHLSILTVVEAALRAKTIAETTFHDIKATIRVLSGPDRNISDNSKFNRTKIESLNDKVPPFVRDNREAAEP